MNIIFNIEISKEYKLIYSLISKENQEILQQEEVIPCITFNKNTIDLFQESDNAIHFLQTWFEHPDDYLTYSVQFQNKLYNLLPEVLFGIVVNEIKKKVEREYIIEKTEIYLPSDNPKALHRIKISLQAINLNGIILSNEAISYDYENQGDFLEEILEKKEIIESFKHMINRDIKL